MSNKDIDFALSLTDTSHLEKKELRTLSGGELQRVLVARAIAVSPELLVLDEPVQGVDFNGEAKLYGLIEETKKRLNCGILLISHDLHMVMSATDQVICLNGHICCSGTPEVVTSSSEFKNLFGNKAASTIAIYQHNHNHEHSLDGSIKSKAITEDERNHDLNHSKDKSHA
jgi:zinc transport system ATP-binding protein